MLIADRYTQVYNGAMGRGFKSKASRAQLGNAWQVIRGIMDDPREYLPSRSSCTMRTCSQYLL